MFNVLIWLYDANHIGPKHEFISLKNRSMSYSSGMLKLGEEKYTYYKDLFLSICKKRFQLGKMQTGINVILITSIAIPFLIRKILAV